MNINSFNSNSKVSKEVEVPQQSENLTNESTRSIDELGQKVLTQNTSVLTTSLQGRIKEPGMIEKPSTSLIEPTPIPSYSFPKKDDLLAKQQLCDNFEIGDVIITKLNTKKTHLLFDRFIIIFQKISKFIGITHKSADSEVIHIAIVTGKNREKGQVIISEAMPGKKHGLRSVDLLSHKSCILKKNGGYSYQIFKAEEPYANTALKAASIAARYAPKASYLLSKEEAISNKNKNKNYVNPFSFRAAFYSMFKKNKSFDIGAQKRAFISIFEEAIQANVAIGNKGQGRKFYCSAFGAQIFQKAALEKAWIELVKDVPELQESLDQLKAKTEGLKTPNAKGDVAKWSYLMAKNYGKQLSEKMESFKIDSMNTTPQELVLYFQQNKIARQAFNIVPPS